MKVRSRFATLAVWGVTLLAATPARSARELTFDDLSATALNLCRGRVCETQRLDSRCPGNDNTAVAQSFAEADVLLDDANRTSSTCRIATCELREINNGHALELNSLTVAATASGLGLTWAPPILDDGTGSAERYEVWRRPLRSSGPSRRSPKRTKRATWSLRSPGRGSTRSRRFCRNEPKALATSRPSVSQKGEFS